MLTDISLISETRKIIIDAKFYKEALQRYFDREIIRSLHVYQISAYMRASDEREGRNRFCEGVLLYPTVKSEVDETYRPLGNKLTVKTLNLNQPWENIHEDLLTIIN